MTEIRVPTLGESVTEATIGKWFKHQGDAVAVDEPLVELETDMMAAIERAAASPTPVAAVQMRAPSPADDAAREERVRMTRLRQTIARRLKDAQNTAAMLTTFNEVDMSAVMHIRNQYKDLFEKKNGLRLGFMGFFVRACVQALKEIPSVNAEIDGADFVYKNYYHIW